MRALVLRTTRLVPGIHYQGGDAVSCRTLYSFGWCRIMSESWPDPPFDPQPDLTPKQRHDEFAAILADGVLRFLRQEAALAPAKSWNSPPPTLRFRRRRGSVCLVVPWVIAWLPEAYQIDHLALPFPQTEIASQDGLEGVWSFLHNDDQRMIGQSEGAPRRSGEFTPRVTAEPIHWPH